MNKVSEIQLKEKIRELEACIAVKEMQSEGAVIRIGESQGRGLSISRDYLKNCKSNKKLNRLVR